MGRLAETPARAAMRRRLIEAAERDSRVVGLLDYGSSSEGRLDEWSDVDVAVFVCDADYDAFARDWVSWAGQLGKLLLAFISHVGHPWTVYAADPVPLRVDFDLYRESEVDQVAAWPNSPVSIEAMVWYDGTAGRLASVVEQLVGRSLAPADPRAAFDRHCGDFWYALLYTFSKLQRGEGWVARQAFYCRVLEPLLRLLRLEAGAVRRWRGSPAALEAEITLSPERLARLERCASAPQTAGVRAALGLAAALGREVCRAVAAKHGWSWPEELARRSVRLLSVEDGRVLGDPARPGPATPAMDLPGRGDAGGHS